MKHEFPQRLSCPYPSGVFTALAASALLHSVLVFFLVGLKGDPPARLKPAVVQVNLKSVRFSSDLETKSGRTATPQATPKAMPLPPQPVRASLPVSGREKTLPDRTSVKSTVATARPASVPKSEPTGPPKKNLAEKIVAPQKNQIRKSVARKVAKPLAVPAPSETALLAAEQPNAEQEVETIVKRDSVAATTRSLPSALSVDRTAAILPQDLAVNDDIEGDYSVVDASQAENPLRSEDALRENYLSLNFGPIRDKVRDNLRYPAIARRQGWTGRVDIEFTISLSGTIDNKRILTSSGYPLLDRQALRAVDVSAPFPPPAVIATVILPITFSLE